MGSTAWLPSVELRKGEWKELALRSFLGYFKWAHAIDYLPGILCIGGAIALRPFAHDAHESLARFTWGLNPEVVFAPVLAILTLGFLQLRDRRPRRGWARTAWMAGDAAGLLLIYLLVALTILLLGGSQPDRSHVLDAAALGIYAACTYLLVHPAWVSLVDSGKTSAGR